jgi:hypothetical protein
MVTAMPQKGDNLVPDSLFDLFSRTIRRDQGDASWISAGDLQEAIPHSPVE